MKPNFRWKKTDPSGKGSVASNAEAVLHNERTLPHNRNEVTDNKTKGVTNSDFPYQLDLQVIKNPEVEGRKSKCFCSSQVIKTRTRQKNSGFTLKNIFYWRPDWRGSFVFVVIVVCLLSRTTQGAVSSDSDDDLIFNGRRLSSFITSDDPVNILQEEPSEPSVVNNGGGESTNTPCGKDNNGVHVKIQYSSSIVENGE